MNFGAIVLLCFATNAEATTIGWTSLPYRSRSDGPFAAVIQQGNGYVEDFEDFAANTPNLQVAHGNIVGAFSVDEDDGLLDNRGSGVFLDAALPVPGEPPLPGNYRWMFDIRFAPDIPGNYPTFAGGFFLGWEPERTGRTPIRYFQAFDLEGTAIFPNPLTADVPILSGPLNNTPGDRFFGAFHDSGISRILFTGLSLDHIQYAYGPIPEPSAAALAGAALAAWMLRRRRTTK